MSFIVNCTIAFALVLFSVDLGEGLEWVLVDSCKFWRVMKNLSTVKSCVLGHIWFDMVASQNGPSPKEPHSLSKWPLFFGQMAHGKKLSVKTGQ